MQSVGAGRGCAGATGSNEVYVPSTLEERWANLVQPDRIAKNPALTSTKS